ncbi:MAG: hypothetical protein N3G22_04095 [Candidatus Micrarchaeota archaeon]|nr:hypothetical protein [Candidatus Micrarchaeota archaeon]
MTTEYLFQLPPQSNQKLDSLYRQIAQTGTLPGELSKDSPQGAMLALSLVAKIIQESNVDFFERPSQSKVFSAQSIYSDKELEGQKVFLLLSSRFADEILKAWLLTPGGSFDSAMTHYLSQHPIVTLSLIKNTKKSIQEMPILLEHEKEGNDWGVQQGKVVPPWEIGEKKLKQTKETILNIVSSFFPLASPIIENNQKLMQALQSPTAKNILEASESQRLLPAYLTIDGIFSLAAVPMPWAKVIQGEMSASKLFALARRAGNEELRAVVVACLNKKASLQELVEAGIRFSKTDAERFLSLPIKEREKLVSEFLENQAKIKELASNLRKYSSPKKISSAEFQQMIREALSAENLEKRSISELISDLITAEQVRFSKGNVPLLLEWAEQYPSFKSEDILNILIRHPNIFSPNDIERAFKIALKKDPLGDSSLFLFSELIHSRSSILTPKHMRIFEEAAKINKNYSTLLVWAYEASTDPAVKKACLSSMAEASRANHAIGSDIIGDSILFTKFDAQKIADLIVGRGAYKSEIIKEAILNSSLNKAFSQLSPDEQVALINSWMGDSPSLSLRNVLRNLEAISKIEADNPGKVAQMYRERRITNFIIYNN